MCFDRMNIVLLLSSLRVLLCDAGRDVAADERCMSETEAADTSRHRGCVCIVHEYIDGQLAFLQMRLHLKHPPGSVRKTL